MVHLIETLESEKNSDKHKWNKRYLDSKIAEKSQMGNILDVFYSIPI